MRTGKLGERRGEGAEGEGDGGPRKGGRNGGGLRTNKRFDLMPYGVEAYYIASTFNQYNRREINVVAHVYDNLSNCMTTTYMYHTSHV